MVGKEHNISSPEWNHLGACLTLLRAVYFFICMWLDIFVMIRWTLAVYKHTSSFYCPKGWEVSQVTSKAYGRIFQNFSWPGYSMSSPMYEKNVLIYTFLCNVSKTLLGTVSNLNLYPSSWSLIFGPTISHFFC